jgi:hypothetical protein
VVQGSVGGLEFEVLSEDRVVCRVYYSEGKRCIEYFGSKLDKAFCPLGVSDSDILEFFDDRAIPSTRVGIAQVLKTFGLSEYNAVELCKKTKGMLNEDVYWVRFSFDKDLTYAKAMKIVNIKR